MRRLALLWPPYLIKRFSEKWEKRQRARTLSKLGNVHQIDGWLSEAEEIALYRLARQVRAHGTILEIGSWKGKSTVCLGLGLRKGKLIAVDSFDAAGEEGSCELYAQRRGTTSLLEEFQSNISRNRISDKVEIWHGRSNEFAERDVVIDLLFIDGDHSIENCKADYLNFAKKLKRHGVIALHDYDPGRPELGPTWVINNLVLSDPSYRFLGRYDSIWTAQKVS